MKFIIILSLVILLVAVSMYFHRIRLSRKNARLATRKSSSLDQIYDEFYSEADIDPILFRQVWLEIASRLRLDAEKILPTDRFDGVLGPVEGFPVEDEIVDVDDFLCNQCKNLNIPLKSGDLNSIDDCIRLLCQKR